jgi:hypothetical protein
MVRDGSTQDKQAPGPSGNGRPADTRGGGAPTPGTTYRPGDPLPSDVIRAHRWQPPADYAFLDRAGRGRGNRALVRLLQRWDLEQARREKLARLVAEDVRRRPDFWRPLLLELLGHDIADIALAVAKGVGR